MRFWLILACCLLATGVLGQHSVLRPNLTFEKRDTDEKKVDDKNDNDDDDGDDNDEPRRLVVYFDFENFKKDKPSIIIDKSGYSNTGIMEEGGLFLKYTDPDYTCNQAARLWDQDILLKGTLFQGKPTTGVTVAAWIKLEQSSGSHSVFDTIGQAHMLGQYHFEVNHGIVRWFHRNEYQKTVFETMAHTVKKDKWTHVVGTYNSKTRHAKIFINGEIRNQSLGEGFLSRDWGVHAGIGNHRKLRGLHGAVDEFRIYNYPLKPDEVKALHEACKGKDDSSNGKSVPEAISPNAEKTEKDAPRTAVPTAEMKEKVINESAVRRVIKKMKKTKKQKTKKSHHKIQQS